MAHYVETQHEALEVGMERESRLARPVLHHADGLKRHGVAKARAHRLRKRFLCRKPVREKQDRLDRPEIARPLGLGQHPPRESLPVFLHQPRYARRLDHVDTDAVDHRAPAMSAFISRTAAGSPVNTARAT